jgi:tRNA(Ile)-lysidine synthase
VHSLAQRVLSHLRQQELLSAGDRVGVAVSGGIDSVALLRLLLELHHELGIVVSVVHFNHKLRGAESDADEQFVANLAREHDLEFHTDSDDVAECAADEHISIETAARDLRYGFFHYLLGEDSATESNNSQTLDKLATGHTLDDQAETVLMRLIRGSGLRGLGGIHPHIPVEDENQELSGEIVRPLLTIRRRELERYLNDIGQPWREDSTNTDDHFTRNRIRKLVVPLLEKEFNPSVVENLAEISEIARGEEDYWDNEISGWLGTTVHWSEPAWARAMPSEAALVQIGLPRKSASSPIDPALQSRIDDAPWLVVNASVSRVWFLGEPTAVQRRLVKAIGEHARIPLEFKHVEEILRFAAEDGPSGKELSLPLGWKLLREPEELVFLTPDLRESTQSQDYEYELPVPGQVVLGQTCSSFEVQPIPAGADAGYNLEQLLDASSLPGPLKVRNWRPGDRFWPAHTKSPKKIKELLQERHVAQPERRFWPVVVSGDEIIWMRAFPSPAKFRAKPGQDAILIIEKLLTTGPAK